jgi:hypothetical protein
MSLTGISAPTTNESPPPTYTGGVNGAVTSTTNVLAIISGASKTTTVKKLIVNGGTATAATVSMLNLIRGTVAAPAAGTAITAATLQHNTTDAAFTGSVLQGISSAITTSGMTSTATAINIPVSVETTTIGSSTTVTYDFTNGGELEGVVIPTGATNSLLFSWPGTAGGANFSILVSFIEQ